MIVVVIYAGISRTKNMQTPITTNKTSKNKTKQNKNKLKKMKNK